jgi:hypothetical protein
LRGGGERDVSRYAGIGEEKTQMQFLLPLSKATKRAAMYAVVSCSAIKKIRQENKARKETHPGNSLRSPGKKRRIIERNVVYVDDFDKCVITGTQYKISRSKKK